MVQGRKPDVARWRRVARLKAAGWAVRRIARRLGVSRQRVEYVLRRLARGERSVPCRGCGKAIVSAAALPGDAADALCLGCLARRPGVPFGQRMKALRLAAGLTRAELTRRTGLCYETIRDWEEGRRPTRQAARLRALARVLGPGLLGDGRGER